MKRRSDDAISVRSDNLAKTAVGLKVHGGVKYQTEVRRLTGLVPPGSTGVNHGELAELSSSSAIVFEHHGVMFVIGISTDGVIALLIVTIVP